MKGGNRRIAAGRKGVPVPMRGRSGREIREHRWGRPLAYVRYQLEDLARRVEASRSLFPSRFFRGDCHAHSQHSDGIGTVAEMAGMARAAGLDFQFVTDHWGLSQAPECRRHGLWAGQEPGAAEHHLGILGLKRVFRPRGSLAEDFERIRRGGGLPFIPHPTGWWPSRVYTQEQIRALDTLPDPFLMEILNGANKLGTGYDAFAEASIRLWDELLCAGRRVHAMGNTDTHSPHGIGSVWNGVYAGRCDQASILRALSAGRHFVSEAPLLRLSVGPVGMGRRARRPGSWARILCDVADSRGLLQVRLIADGRVCGVWHPDGRPVQRLELPLPRSARIYVRLEAVASDGRRGFTNPVYLGGGRGSPLPGGARKPF